MPELCRFSGIVIRMYLGDHSPPHFHAEYAEYADGLPESKPVKRVALPPVT
ncbi:MAG: DUF4160 domain-containing protein [Acidimicrobiaceae bacterium]|nr:DUF4160 domain-containing protein [Acidimicrobiaceae bacterium]MXZ99674.1 DUF4160 domain-containing protein [Acidimicrobiaceae bacterium]MYE76549.1 DUF4160 domain-containing protein [Acidimicrobiaceae bacterium]MYE98531.1 DUF4160 domain-containing protein [Acidimicrobiaceae bacterium]MYI54618.1 DUF4160 domain-containing protein [Acidimicrobiaceae bacterium]